MNGISVKPVFEFSIPDPLSYTEFTDLVDGRGTLEHLKWLQERYTKFFYSSLNNFGKGQKHINYYKKHQSSRGKETKIVKQKPYGQRKRDLLEAIHVLENKYTK